MAIVNRTNSFDLAIENQYRDQATPVLYIVSFPREDDDTQHVRFRFTNRTNKEYVLKALTTADADNFHFALVFRPNTLQYNDPGEIQAKFQAAIDHPESDFSAIDQAAIDMTGYGDKWLVSAPITQEDSTEVIYFSAKAGRTIKENEGIAFLVIGLSGAAATGSRSTQVQLLFQEPVGAQFITRVRNQHLDIVNHDGKTFAPLDFVILGDPTLIHRSQDNVLRIQVVETNGRPIAVSKETFIDFKFPYYKGDYDPDYHPAWVFGSSDNVGNIRCQKNENEEMEITTDTVGNDISFNLPNLDKNKKPEDPTAFEWGYKNIRIKFGAGETINNQLLKFLQVPADGPIGDARIKITVSNLPGYWDTEFELRVHKTLLTTAYYPKLERSYGMLNNQVVVGKELPEGPQMEGALYSTLSVTSADINDKDGHSVVTELLRLVDGKISMNGLGICVGNWQEPQDINDPPKANDPRLKDGFLIKADQYNHGPRFTVDFFGNLWADRNISANKDLSAKGNITAGGDIAVKGRVKDATGLVMPVGAIIAYGGSAAPEGWLLCDGQTSLNDKKYEELKKAINLDTTPDLRSRFVVGAGQGGGTDKTGNRWSNYSVGNKGGEETHTLTVDQMPNHDHTKPNHEKLITSEIADHKHWIVNGNKGSADLNTNVTIAYKYEPTMAYKAYNLKGSDNGEEADWGVSSGSGKHTHDFSIPQQGGNEAHNNLPPYYALTYIIKY
jgi:microcystin-dependent protein